jgi:hypothetical protein
MLAAVEKIEPTEVAVAPDAGESSGPNRARGSPDPTPKLTGFFPILAVVVARPTGPRVAAIPSSSPTRLPAHTPAQVRLLLSDEVIREEVVGAPAPVPVDGSPAFGGCSHPPTAQAVTSTGSGTTWTRSLGAAEAPFASVRRSLSLKRRR